jgi:hypothetical protein
MHPWHVCQGQDHDGTIGRSPFIFLALLIGNVILTSLQLLIEAVDLSFDIDQTGLLTRKEGVAF